MPAPINKVDVFRISIGIIVTLSLIIASFVFGTSVNNRDRIECVEKDMVEVKAQGEFSSKSYEVLRRDVMQELKEIQTSIRELEKKVVLLNNRAKNP